MPFSLAVFLLACGAYDDSALAINGFPSELILGTTTPVFTVTKKARDAQGSMQTDANYTSFYLTSSDTTIARIVNSRQVFAAKTGQALITAKDSQGSLASPAYVLKVL